MRSSFPLIVCLEAFSDISYCSQSRPQYPRAKINGTPDGVTSVHIGVRPRAPPVENETGSMRNVPSRARGKGAQGKGKGNAEGRAARGTSDWASRREGYGEVHSDIQDGSSTASSSHSDFASGSDRRQPQSSRYDQPGRRKDDKRSMPTEQQRALPRMTLEQAMAQWEKDHPSATDSSDGTRKSADNNAARLGDSWQTSDDGPAHDGIYTYDYSGPSNKSAGNRGNGSSGSRGDGSSSFLSAQSSGTVVHVDGTEGPVRIYPPPPEHENAYGVPFGKRLKALVHMRKEAEASGLVPLSGSKNQMLAAPREVGRASGLARRSAVMSRSTQEEPRVGRASMGETTRPESPETPTIPTACLTATTTPRTPSASPQKQGRHVPSSARVDPRFAPANPDSLSEPPTKKSSEGKLHRKPVPSYIGADECTVRGDRHVDSGETLIRKQKSESDVKDNAAKVRKDRKGKFNSPEKR